MSLSSRFGDGKFMLKAPSVTNQGPQNVHPSPGQREDCLGVPFAFSALAFVEATGRIATADTDQRGGIKDSLEAR